MLCDYYLRRLVREMPSSIPFHWHIMCLVLSPALVVAGSNFQGDRDSWCMRTQLPVQFSPFPSVIMHSFIGGFGSKFRVELYLWSSPTAGMYVEERQTEIYVIHNKYLAFARWCHWLLLSQPPWIQYKISLIYAAKLITLQWSLRMLSCFCYCLHIGWTRSDRLYMEIIKEMHSSISLNGWWWERRCVNKQCSLVVN